MIQLQTENAELALAKYKMSWGCNPGLDVEIRSGSSGIPDPRSDTARTGGSGFRPTAKSAALSEWLSSVSSASPFETRQDAIIVTRKAVINIEVMDCDPAKMSDFDCMV